ncbi:MAG: class I SAM-dependent methyltransferase [Trichloromonas sp.]|nr:class I SAM-dependent methyltransferase [Trichloromonas sp.]
MNYERYLTCHPSLAQTDNLDRMAAYYRKNYRDLLGGTQKKILDVACGAGHFLYFLKKEGYRDVRAVDLCGECVEHCIANGFIEADRITRGDALDFLQEKTDLYDAVVMNDLVEHLEKNRVVATLAAARERLSVDGCLIIKVVNAANPITGSSSRYGDFTHTLGFTEESLSQVLRMAGFSRIELRPQNIWVFNPLVNLVGRVLQGGINLLFRTLFLLYGRKTTTIFTKDVIAVAKN